MADEKYLFDQIPINQHTYKGQRFYFTAIDRNINEKKIKVKRLFMSHYIIFIDSILTIRFNQGI